VEIGHAQSLSDAGFRTDRGHQMYGGCGQNATGRDKQSVSLMRVGGCCAITQIKAPARLS
jgi:hypothetical protein